MKKVGFVIRKVNRGGGVEIVLKNLIAELDNSSFSGDFELVVFTDIEYFFLRKLSKIKVVVIPKKNLLVWDYFLLPLKLAQFNLDLIIYPKNVIPITNFPLRSKKIIIVNDLAYFEKDIKAYKKFDTAYMRLNIGFSCKNCDKIISISQYTKDDIVKKFRVNEDKAIVMPLAVEDKFKCVGDQLLERVKEKYGLEKPFVFYSGSISPRKNIFRMLEAFNQIKNKLDVDFYLTGARGWNNVREIEKFILENKLQKRVKKIGFVDYNDLPAVYSLAGICLYPSLYEGFGLPILEAQACGCPVLTSNVTSCPEVAGDGAHIVDPYSIDEIRDGIMKIFGDDQYKNQLIQKGLSNIKRFSWSKSALKLIEVIQNT